MKRFVTALVWISGVAVVSAQPKPQTPPPAPLGLPIVGDQLPPGGAPGWPTHEWMYDAPAITDAAGKIVIHWFCAPKVQACIDDLARVITLKENNPRVYIIAYINGTKREAEKLDPIRESEGVGRGTVAFGKNAVAMFKKLGIAGPASIVVDTTYKVAQVSLGGAPGDLDARDAKVIALANAIKDYTVSFDGPKTVNPNDKFSLTITINLASWLSYSKKAGGSVFQVTVPKELKCDATTLKDDQLKISGQQLIATAKCSGPRGSYEARGQINFGYTSQNGATGFGADGTSWKFEIK